MNTASESSAAGSAKVIGVITILLGVAALAAPFVVGESMLLFIGFVVTAAGVLRMIWAFRTQSLGSGLFVDGLPIAQLPQDPCPVSAR